MIDGKQVSVEEFDEYVGANEHYGTLVDAPKSVELYGEQAKDGVMIFSNKKSDIEKLSDKIIVAKKGKHSIRFFVNLGAVASSR